MGQTQGTHKGNHDTLFISLVGNRNMLERMFMDMVPKALEGTVLAFLQNITGQKIEITSPRPSEALRYPENFGSNLIVCEVRGKLKKLPNGHRVWLLIQDPIYDKAWPQGFQPVIYDPKSCEWSGKVMGSPGTKTRVVAVVAPPTSCEFFQYYEQVGAQHNNYAPLQRIPSECYNQASVQTQFP